MQVVDTYSYRLMAVEIHFLNLYLTNPTYLYMCVNDIHEVVNDIHELIETNPQCGEQSFRLIYKAKLLYITENGPCLAWVGCSHIVFAGNAGECVSAPTRIRPFPPSRLGM